ncbi:Mannan endo-1,6-alpha-mannosidase DCW1 [Tolypocladium ophioglossoides CBS 100239]|uniref:Mannan endo-1,6-alpha-mannosidase n=1 Tax=Tolypocladium ophioglossoides (strain CBS 100239) TaxID=1163406 RepID=A0A0L0NGD5_TOLOC|nr:Mannan endo-1,6-alpha-mannosidase DCW1 [Tolypocladium ophioglossoides CBS 100239]
MKFYKSVHAAAALSGIVAPKDLDTQSSSSVRNVAATLAHDTMAYYSGNTSAPNSIEVENVPKPYYWWVAGALWGAMLDYYHFTKDPSYNDVVLQALLAPTNIAPSFDYMPKEHAQEEGNDDLFFWGSAVMSAAERNFPQPKSNIPSWIDIAANVFNSLTSRWDSKNCNGGLLWQIYADNPNGMTYKNSISNGGLFQLAARLARATGNDTYLDWAQKVWDWSAEVGIIDPDSYHIYDGVDIKTSCKQVNKVSFTYTSGVFMYGAAVLANHTGKQEWADRADKLLDGAGWFFSTDSNSKNVMMEAACEPYDKCNYDMITFKGYLSRFMWQTSVMVPGMRDKIESLLIPSAKAAASVCTGGKDGHQCGMKWYGGSYDNKPGLGPQMCALETIQGLLIHESAPPLTGKDVKLVTDTNWKPIDTYAVDSATTSKRDVSSPTKKSAAARLGGEKKAALVLVGVVTALAAWGLA